MNYFDYLVSKSKVVYERGKLDKFIKKTKFEYLVPSIHITGSNGKGQTANFLANIYIDNGYKVGLFISPYFALPCELIAINNKNISEEEFEKYINENKKAFDKFDLTEFEIESIIAFKYFQDNKCDIAIIECGMGALIDATNIFNPILSIITSISLEHTSYLGRTLSEIAYHKAGIIKENVPVIIGDLPEEALNVIVEESRYLSSKIYSISPYNGEHFEDGKYVFNYLNYQSVPIKTLSLNSITNACFAIEATNVLNERFPVQENKVIKALERSSLPGRFEIHGNIVVDGAHNPEAIENLVKDMNAVFVNKNIKIVFAGFLDKNIQKMLTELNFLSNDIYLTTFNHKRARTKNDYFLFLEEYKFEEDYVSLIKTLKQEYPDDIILVTGSLYFANLIVSLINGGKFDE